MVNVNIVQMVKKKYHLIVLPEAQHPIISFMMILKNRLILHTFNVCIVMFLAGQ